MGRISFDFKPRDENHAVEKREGVRKKKYLYGISTGPNYDAHSERMTERCVSGFMEQANRGDLLLYADLHGIRSTEDIGIMTKAEITDTGEWSTEYRLYDETDGVDRRSVETAGKLWKQILGKPPYRYPRKKGFSIEGIVPDEDGIIADSQGRKMLDWIDLDGVLVVDRPAYRNSIAVAVQKALGDGPFETSLANQLRDMIETDQAVRNYHEQKYTIDDAMTRVVEEIMRVVPDPGERRSRLEQLYNDYAAMMVDVIMQSPPETFIVEDGNIVRDMPAIEIQKDNILKAVAENIDNFVDSTQRRLANVEDLEKQFEVVDGQN